MSDQMSKSLACWSRALDVTHRIAESTRKIEATKESLQALHEICRRMDELEMDSFQQALSKLGDCETKIEELCETGVPLIEQHKQVEICLKRMIESRMISETEISEVKRLLDSAIKICERYLVQMKNFLTDMEKLRELFAKVIGDVEKESAEFGTQATSAKRWGYGLAAGLFGVAAILGITCSIVAPPVAVAVCVGAAAGMAAKAGAETAHKTLLGARQLTEKADLFREAAAALQACDSAFEALEQKVRQGPVPISEELIDGLRHVLQVYGMVHEKDEENVMLRAENIQLAAERELSIARESKMTAEVERLNRLLAQQQSRNEAGPNERT